MLFTNSLAPAAIPRTSAKQTELSLSVHKNMRPLTKIALYINICATVIRSNTYKVYGRYRTLFFNNKPLSIAMKIEYLTHAVRVNTKIIDNDDNRKLLLYKEAYHIKRSALSLNNGLKASRELSLFFWLQLFKGRITLSCG